MATFTKIADFVEAMAEQEHDLSADSIRYALSNVAPGSESPNIPINTGLGILANVTQISYTNHTDDNTTPLILDNVTSVEASGTWTFDCDSFIITAVTGTMPTWQYLYVYNDTPTAPADPLIGVWDHGSAIILLLGETANININASGMVTIA